MASDFQINSGVRSLLAKHWIDLKKVQLGAFHGTVRLTGELCRLGGECASDHDPRLVDNLDAEIRMIRGVERVYFELTNWRRGGGGEWICTDRAARAKTTTSSSGESMVLNVQTSSQEGRQDQPKAAARRAP